MAQSAVVTVTIDVSPVNGVPTAIADAYNVDEDQTLTVLLPGGVLGNDTDDDGDTLTAVLVTDVSHGTLVLNQNGSFEYTPAANYHGPDSFTYRADDGMAQSAVVTVTIDVSPVNDQPNITSTEVVEALADVAYAYDVDATDPDGDVLTYSLDTAPIDMTIDSATGQITWTPTAGDAGVHDVTVRVKDQDEASDTQTFTITVVASGEALVSFSPDGLLVTVVGSTGDDLIEVDLGDANDLVVNGEQYTLGPATKVTIEGGGGFDRVILTGSSDTESGTLNPGSATLIGPSRRVEVDDVSEVVIHGGGGMDSAWLFDSPGDDYLAAGPGSEPNSNFAELSAASYSSRVESFSSVNVYGSSGYDTADLFDSAGSDTFTARPGEASLSGPGFDNRVRYFEDVTAYGGTGSFDEAFLYDSPGNDRFVATPTYSELSGREYHHRAENFPRVYAYATAGGTDVARLFDSPGDDEFFATPERGSLYDGQSFDNQANGFDNVHAYATAGGHDVATIVGSSGSDTFVASPIEGALVGDGFYNRAKHFEEIHAQAGSDGQDEAFDEAFLQDSAMPDQLMARDNWAQLRNEALDFLFEVIGFDDVTVTSTSSGDTKDAPSLALLDFNLHPLGIWDDIY